MSKKTIIKAGPITFKHSVDSLVIYVFNENLDTQVVPCNENEWQEFVKALLHQTPLIFSSEN